MLQVCLDLDSAYITTFTSECNVCCSGPLPLQEVVCVAIEVLEALGQLHAAHILHLDLKPGNILLDEYRHAYLSDFGVSHAVTGTPHYM